MKFPQRNKLLTIIVALHANGNSSYRDATNLRRLFNEKWGDNGKQIVITDRQSFENGLYVKNKTEFLPLLTRVVETHSKEYDILFTISAHGYSAGEDEYIRVGSDVIMDRDIRDAFYDEMDVSCNSLCLVDTCHSGTMLDLPWQSTDGHVFRKNEEKDAKNLTQNSYCISACNDNELAGEDISNYGGWGGKLVCLFLDYYKSQRIDIEKFYKHVFRTFTSQSGQKSHPIISRT